MNKNQKIAYWKKNFKFNSTMNKVGSKASASDESCNESLKELNKLGIELVWLFSKNGSITSRLVKASIANELNKLNNASTNDLKWIENGWIVINGKVVCG